jgi:hypothetical protein
MVRAVKYAYFFTFWIVLLAFPVASILDLRTSSNESFIDQEKREITRLPNWNWESKRIKKYFSESESYCGDHLAFREDLLKLNATLKYGLGIPMDTKEVVIGKDGWLFLGNKYQGTIDQYRGLKQLDAKQILSFYKYFGEIEAYLKDLKIPFYLAIAPDKHSIYPEYLPSYLSRKGVTPFDQIMASNTSLQIIDLKKVLIEKKKNHKLPLYYKTDSHWNHFGAYLAYCEILSHFDTSLHAFSIILNENNFKSRLSQRKTDLPLTMKGESLFNEVEVSINDKLSKDNLKLYANNKWVELNPNMGIDMINHNLVKNKHKNGKVLVIGDSFSNSLSIYLNNTFGEIKYCHSLRSDTNDIASLVQQYKPDYVLFEIVERYLQAPIGSFIHLEKKEKIGARNRLDNKKIQSQSVFNQQITNVGLSGDGIHFTSIGNDPYFYLPKIEFPSKNINLKIGITTPASTTFQIFYLTNSDSIYNEKHSIKKPVPQGYQQLTFSFNTDSVNRNLRIDPGTALGDYVIHSLEIW